ncbi:hypothetical protein ABT052_29190 [Streptomyces sp. NPDC002766]|uniref:hypothetical protein n=1 Tax=Streptomyces sp. NPDC002766 TaxID=3154429 RepID=UPI00332256C7
MLDPQQAAQNNPQIPPPAPVTPQPPARPSRIPALAGAGLGSVSTLTLVTTGAPWPAVLTLALAGLAVVLAQSILQALAPQDSHDRLTWWTTRWNHRSQHHPTHTPQPEPPPPHAGQAT